MISSIYSNYIYAAAGQDFIWDIQLSYILSLNTQNTTRSKNSARHYVLAHTSIMHVIKIYSTRVLKLKEFHPLKKKLKQMYFIILCS